MVYLERQDRVAVYGPGGAFGVERLCTQISQTTNEEELSMLNEEKASLEIELNAQEEVVNGYDAEEV